MAYEATFIQNGDVIPYTPSGTAVSAGEVIVVGVFIAVAKNDIAIAEEGVLSVVGVFDVDTTADAAGTFTAGDIVYWDESANVATNTDATAANEKMGVSVAVCAEATTTVRVRLER